MTATALSSEALALLAGTTVLRATLLLAGAALVAFALRRGPGTLRHALWSVTLVALLALPLLTWALPAVSVPLPLPAAIAFTAPQEEGTPAPHTAVDVVPLRLVPANAWLDRESERAAGAVIVGPAVAAPAPAPGTRRIGLFPVATWLAAGLSLLWGAGALALGLPLAVGLRRAARLCRRALPLGAAGWDEPAWIEALRRAAQRVGFRRRVVLTHELVHLRRGDALRQVIGRLVLAL